MKLALHLIDGFSNWYSYDLAIIFQW